MTRTAISAIPSANTTLAATRPRFTAILRHVVRATVGWLLPSVRELAPLRRRQRAAHRVRLDDPIELRHRMIPAVMAEHARARGLGEPRPLGRVLEHVEDRVGELARRTRG